MSNRLPLADRETRMNQINDLLDQERAFPLTVRLGDRLVTFPTREAVAATLAEARGNALRDGLAVYEMPNGKLMLAPAAAIDPVRARFPAPRGWLGIDRGWLRNVRA